MNLLKEGIIYKNEKLWRNSGEYYLSLGLGTWDPTVSQSQEIYQSESNSVRFLINQDEITTDWSTLRGVDIVKIDKSITPQEDIRFNRLFVSYDSRNRAKYSIKHKPFNTIEITEPLSNPFQLGDRVYCNSNFYSVADIEGFIIALEPYPLAPNLPNGGEGYIVDAKGILLIGSVLDSQYIIKKDTTVNIILEGSTF